MELRPHLLLCVSSQFSHHRVLYCQDLISVDFAIPYIPIFGKDDVLGNIYPMLGELGGGNGSVELNLELPHAQSCVLKYYLIRWYTM